MSQRFPSYRQWKAWRHAIASVHLRLCFICNRPLASTDGLATKRIIGGKAAAFGGNGRETLGYNTPEDRVKAGCTVKVKTLESRTVTPAQTIMVHGHSWNMPEVIEEKFKDKLMTVSVTGIGCEVCRIVASMSERNWVDVSVAVMSCDPDDAPMSESMIRGTKCQDPHGVRAVCNDNIRRVVHREAVTKWVAPVIKDDVITERVSESTVQDVTIGVPTIAARLLEDTQALEKVYKAWGIIP